MRSRPAIGALSPLPSGEYCGALISGIRATAAEHGRRLIAIQTLDARTFHAHQDDNDFASQVAWSHVEGFVVIINAVSPAYLAAIRAAGKPIVMISNEVPGFLCPVVVPDNRSGVREAVGHLIGHGHTRIAFAGNLAQSDVRERWEGYCGTLREHGIEPDPALFYETGDNYEDGGQRAGHAMVQAGLPSTAVMAATDYNAFGIINVLTSAGHQLPADQAIVGFDNSTTGAHLWPALSSVSQHLGVAGGTAASLLFDQIAGRSVAPGRHQIRTSLVTRESCGCGSTASFPPQREGGVDGAANRLVARLREPFAEVSGKAATTAVELLGNAGGRIVEAFRCAASDAPCPADSTILGAVEQIFTVSSSRESAIGVLGSAQELVRDLLLGANGDAAMSIRLDSAILELTLATLQVQLRTEYTANRRLRASMRHEYDVSIDLLRGHETHPRALGWLGRTQVRAGCVGVWTGQERGTEPMIEIAGLYDAKHRDPAAVGRVSSESEFPPTQIMEMVDGSDDVVFVLPVRTNARDWGLLAIVGPAETSTELGRESYFQWAVQLSVALDHEAVVDSLRSQREDLGAAYNRERGLVENIRVSEERYALAARAANDGLWDWDLTSGEIFYSARWKEMLGYHESSIGTRTAEWFDRVHPGDLPGLLELVQPRRGGEVKSFEHEHRVRARGGDYRWILCRALAVPGTGHPTTRMVGSLTDITERKELEDRLRQGALYDALTGLPNRTLFLDRLDRALAHSRRRQDFRFVVLFLDLDGFKLVNDSLGHPAGDLLLVRVGERIKRQLRDSDTAARIGGDEFAILLSDVADLGAVPAIVDRLQAALALPYDLDGHEVVVSASIGIAPSTTGYELPEDMLRDSDIAMYRAKSKERGTYAMFDVSMHERAVKRMSIESELRHAIEHREFELRYQPIVELGTHRIEALEALVRWRHPERGLIGPDDFLPIAEETGLIVPVGRLIVERVCEQLATWAAEGAPSEEVRVSVNVSNREFWHADFQAHLDASVEAAGTRPEWLNLEITEGVIMANPEVALRLLLDLRRKGFHLQIDDFGTGYSSLDALHRFPIEALKIDQSFVSRLEIDRKSRELVRTIIMMGRNLDMDVIAEGIENDAQEAILQGLGCVYGQGFWFARPVGADAARALIGGREISTTDVVRLPGR